MPTSMHLRTDVSLTATVSTFSSLTNDGLHAPLRSHSGIPLDEVSPQKGVYELSVLVNDAVCARSGHAVTISPINPILNSIHI